ncbi:FliH/SctL family protein [Rhodospirillaceae bacterium SYSU D60014]|uniref:FliH/SctL family protein n=1 Tax=Virgifigura deserti TaxID=2268457 RepID=UPI000E66B61E
MRTETYRFDRIFHPGPDGNDTEAPQSEMTQEMIEEIIGARVEAAVENARKEAYAEAHALGYEAGRASAWREHEANIASEISSIGSQIEAVAKDLGRIEKGIQMEAANTVTVLVQRLAPELLSANAGLKIDSLVAEAMAKVRGGGRLIIRVSPAHYARVKAAVADARDHDNMETVREVVVDEALANGAIDIQWDGGGVGYDPKEIEVEVGRAVDRVMQTLSRASPVSISQNVQGVGHGD